MVRCLWATPLTIFGLCDIQFCLSSLLLALDQVPPLYRISHNTDMDPETANQAIKLSPKNGANADIVDSMSKVSLDDGHPETLDKRTMGQPTRRLVIYPRPQILRLSKSPLVKPPVNMPALKDWFGYGFHLIY